MGVPGRIAEPECPATGTDLNYANLPDPMLRVVSRLLDRQNRLEERLHSMQKALPGPEAERLTAQIKDIIIRGDDSVEVDMVLTTQACPMVSPLTQQSAAVWKVCMASGRLRLRSWMSPGTGTTLSGRRRRKLRYGCRHKTVYSPIFRTCRG